MEDHLSRILLGDTNNSHVENFKEHVKEYWGIEDVEAWVRSWTPDATEELTERPADLLGDGTLETWLDFLTPFLANCRTMIFSREKFLFGCLARSSPDDRDL